MGSNRRLVIMVASENGALRAGKVGGVGDVVRGLPSALAKLGWRVIVIIPAYGFLHKVNPSRLHCKISFPFGGKRLEGEFWRSIGTESPERVTHLLFNHPQIRGDPIYFDDPSDVPFLRDATKFALFCSAVGKFLATTAPPFVLHLHDWHTATLLMLRELHPEFTHLRGCKTIFTIHNLAIQGTRPMIGSESSVQSWFPELMVDQSWIPTWKDPRYEEPCYTPMAIGIRYAGKINTVSPTYAEEILEPSEHTNDLYRGEGLEKFLQDARKENRFFGILNGCDYRNERITEGRPVPELCNLIISEINSWKNEKDNPIYDELIARIEALKTKKAEIILTSISRVVEQKVKLFFEKDGRGRIALDEILSMLMARDGIYIFLGSGMPEYENLFVSMFRRYERFLFIQGYSDKVAEALYACGNLFLMPSSFEPCGISQMLAMQNGQPCVVHSVGGLTDTVIDRVNGFGFYGNTISERVQNFMKVTMIAMDTYFNDKQEWNRIRAAASRARFTWEDSAKQYVDLLYN